MREFIRTRFACDYCNKKGGSRYHMKKHEKGCTKNPDRTCGLCGLDGEDNQAPTEDLLVALEKDRQAVLKKHGPPVEFEDFLECNTIKPKNLIEAANNCPNCILSTLRIADHRDVWFEYDYKKELDFFWSEFNSEGY